MSERFVFDGATGLASRFPDAFVAVMPSGIASEQDLFEVYARILDFPDYFGRNWNAFFDCLRDLSWVPQQTVVIAHAGLPAGLGTEDLKIYVDVLEEAVSFWREPENPEHSLVVGFPPGEELSIYRLRKQAAQ